MNGDDTQIIMKQHKWEWMPKIVRGFLAVPAVFIDGTIVFLIGVLTALSLGFTNDDAYKYVNPSVLFWTKIGIGALAQGLVSLQSFRSKIYATYSANKQQKPTV